MDIQKSNNKGLIPENNVWDINKKFFSKEIIGSEMHKDIIIFGEDSTENA